MLTEFGKFCRKLRIDNGELLKDMADKLCVSAAYLSAVEVGRRNIPKEWPEILAETYSLNKKQIANLNEAVENSKTKVKIDLNGFSTADRELAISFAREFKDLDDDIKERIRLILNQHN